MIFTWYLHDLHDIYGIYLIFSMLFVSCTFRAKYLMKKTVNLSGIKLAKNSPAGLAGHAFYNSAVGHTWFQIIW